MSTQPTQNRVTVTVKSQIRYEGILYQINAEDKNITLTQVRSFGTEGRRPSDEIPPSPVVHDYIVFRGTDIVDLKVLGQVQATDTEDASKIPTTTSTDTTQTTKSEILAPTTNKQGTEGKTVPTNKFEETKEKHQDEGEDEEGDDFEEFMKGNEKFQQEINNEIKQGESGKSYNKSKGFFDTISTSTTENSRDNNFDRQHQKRLDGETFGEEFYQKETVKNRGYGGRGGRGGHQQGNRYHNRDGGNQYHGGRGGGRGGYSRGSGGGRGGYGGGSRGGYSGGGGGGGGYSGGGRGGYSGGGGYQKGGDYSGGGGGYQKGGDYNGGGGGDYQKSDYQKGYQDDYNQGGGYSGGGYSRGGGRGRGGYSGGGRGGYSGGGRGGYGGGDKKFDNADEKDY